MSVNMHVRDVPDDVHAELQRRAGVAGMSLRQYTIDVLAAHCRQLSVDEWLAAVTHRRTRALVDAADAVREARRQADERLDRSTRRSRGA
jgi:hypothetical protein